VSIAP
jgi:chromosome segregation ATPase